MNFKNYLKSKQIIIYFQILLNLLLCYYVISSNGDYFLLISSLVIIDLNFVILFMYQYYKFNKLITNLSESEKYLDQKFLIKDIQTHYMSYEEELIYEVIDRISKSQYQVIKQKNAEIKEEKEYRTIWIHDIKQPLAILKEDNLSKYERIVAVNKISKKLNYMLYYDKIDNIAADLHFNELKLKQEVNSCIRELSSVLVALNPEIKIEIADAITIYSDKFWLQFMFEQVISNSIKYRSKDQRLLLKFAYFEDEQYQYLEITDNGIGIPDNDFKNVFDKGYRGINAKEQENASGLGLYYVATIAKHLNMKVELQNNENTSGITTCFKFPKYK